MRGWFTIDVLSIIPFEQVLELIFSGSDTAPASGTRMIRMARLARFARLIRLSKLANMRKFFKMVNNTLHNIGVSQPGMPVSHFSVSAPKPTLKPDCAA